jgi:hypothetical protein
MKTLLFTTCTAAASLLLAGCNPPTPKTEIPAPTTQAATPTSEAKSPVTITPSANEPKHAWNTEQILTCTVSQCWQLAGRNEEGFFDIVQQLAVISAKNRDLVLPETEQAGEQAGEYIKAQAHKDHQQLLYAVVDDAIRKVAKPATSN